MTTNLHGCKTAVLVGRGYAHRRVHGRRRGSRTVGAAGRAGVVLRAAPAQPDARVTDGVSLHLVDRHLGSVALDELDETAALSRRDLDVGNLAESLEEGAQLILGDVAGESTNEHGGVVGVGELVHGLRSTVEAHGRSTHRGVHARGPGHTHGTGNNAGTLVLGGGSGDAHGTVAAVDALHFAQSALLVVLVGETDETVATGHAADGVSHDLGGLARREAALEERDEDVFVHFGAKVTNEDGVLGATVVTAVEQCISSIQDGNRLHWIVPAVGKTSTGSPVQLEEAVGVRHGGAVQGQGLGSGGGRGKIDEAVTGIAPTTIIRIAFKSHKKITQLLTQRTCRGSS